MHRAALICGHRHLYQEGWLLQGKARPSLALTRGQLGLLTLAVAARATILPWSGVMVVTLAFYLQRAKVPGPDRLISRN
ncbi:hypothetical protein NL676_033413 [Syzygium grande]|nr:hypothetical protein NL676_033413 [Syzygium grande]